MQMNCHNRFRGQFGTSRSTAPRKRLRSGWPWPCQSPDWPASTPEARCLHAPRQSAKGGHHHVYAHFRKRFHEFFERTLPVSNADAPFLPPIENPASLMMKMVYRMARRQFGKVMTPIKVYSARMPIAFGMFAGKIGTLDKKLTLPKETQLLIREHVAHINVCTFCTDIGRWFVMKASMNEAKFDALEDYRISPLFNDAERAALDYVTELTRDKKSESRNVCPHGEVSTPSRQICEIVWLVATEHVYNINQHPARTSIPTCSATSARAEINTRPNPAEMLTDTQNASVTTCRMSSYKIIGLKVSWNQQLRKK